jgi:hypothetical protein
MTMIRPALALTTLLAVACSGGPAGDTDGRADGEGNAIGNPEGYAVHVLSGESLSARDVAINDRSIDTSTVEAIDDSVAAILDGEGAPATVEEVDGVSPDLSVDFTGPAAPVPDTFHGADIQWRSKFFFQNPRWRALVRHMRLDLLRFPGGQERVRYDGPDSTSGTPETDTLEVTDDQPYEFRMSGEDVAGFIDLAEEVGAQAHPAIDVTVDDPQMAASFVGQIVDDLGYDLRSISVGNEPDIDSPNGNWPYLGAVGDTDEERRANALANYAQRYVACRAAIDAVKPGLVYSLAELGDWSPQLLGPNLDTILGAIAGDQPGALASHWYMLGHWEGQPETDPGFPTIEHLVVDGNREHNIGYLATIASTLREAGAAHGLDRPKLFLGEFGTSWSATEFDAVMADRLAAALFNAEAQETGKAAGLDSMLWFGLSDPASFAPWVASLIEVDDTTGTPRPRPQYYVYLMYKYLYGDETVPVDGGINADWSIFAARGGDRSSLMLINRSESTTVTRVVKAKTATGERLLRLTLAPHSLSIVSF